MATCPAGHTSESTDYCDICGSPMDAAPTTTTPAAGPDQPAPKVMGVVCPNCGVMNAPGALFCEACGYDYTTGTMPQRPDPLSILDLDTPLPDPGAPASAADTEPETGSAANPVTTPETVAPPLPPMTSPAVESTEIPTTDTPARDTPARDTFDWVVEVWIDPEWYAVQQSPDPLPSPGLPDVIPLRKDSLLIGRPSRSRGIQPDIDCEPDTGTSRRQAELSTDGSRWFIEDLGSANGTYVAEAAGGLPVDPIPTGRRRELEGDERIYLGAWTRLVLRRATPEEQEAYATV